MNNIYVDEFPDCCGNCSLCCKDDLGYWCQATTLIYVDERFVAEKRLNSCPLKLLTDRLAEERIRVCGAVYKLTRELMSFGYDTIKIKDVETVLEQFDRGE